MITCQGQSPSCHNQYWRRRRRRIKHRITTASHPERHRRGTPPLSYPRRRVHRHREPAEPVPKPPAPSHHEHHHRDVSLFHHAAIVSLSHHARQPCSSQPRNRPSNPERHRRGTPSPSHSTIACITIACQPSQFQRRRQPKPLRASPPRRQPNPSHQAFSPEEITPPSRASVRSECCSQRLGCRPAR